MPLARPLFGRVNREVSACVIRINAIKTITRRSTRCCDAQGAGAVVYSINAISAARRGGRVNRERRAVFRIMPSLSA